jgi:hypothetical protein
MAIRNNKILIFPFSFFLILIVSCPGLIVIAQTSNDKTVVSVDSLQKNDNYGIRYDHQGNIYTWSGRGKHLYNKSDLSLLINEEFNSNIIESSQRYIQDIQNFGIKLSDKLYDGFKYTVRINSTIYSDDKSIGISNAYTHEALTGITYLPFNYFSVSALGGWKFDDQMGIKDNGASFLLNSKLENYNLGGYLSNLEAEWNSDYLSPRNNNNRWLNLMIQKKFSEVAWNNLSFFYRNFDKDFYIVSNTIDDFNIEKRRENNLVIADELNYIPDSWITMSMSAVFANKDVTKKLKNKSVETLTSNIFDSNIDELKIDLILQVTTDFGWMKNYFKIGVNEREEDHKLDYYEGVSRNYYVSRSKSESYKDNTSTSNFISFSSYFFLSEKNNLNVSSMYNILRYDTPSDNNFDDRDEVQMLVNVIDEHKFNKNFLLKTLFEFNRYRTIFIFGERSANNQSNNILKFSAFTDYTYSQLLKTKNMFEVLSNYTVYDFKDKIASLKNLAFRQFQFFDSTIINLSKIIAIDFFSNIRLSERGELFWDDFKEKPADYYVDQTYSFTIWYKESEFIKFGIGYKTYSQNRYIYKSNVKKLDYTQANHGPTGSMVYQIDNDFNLRLTGWYEVIVNQGRLTAKNKNLMIDLFYFF